VSEKTKPSASTDLLEQVKAVAPQTYTTSPSPSTIVYHLKTRDTEVVGQVLNLADKEVQAGRVLSYDVLGTTIEDIFLDLMNKEAIDRDDEKGSTNTLSPSPPPSLPKQAPIMDLPTGRPVSPFRQAFTIFHKRVLIAKRSWLTPLLAILVAIAGSGIPLVFLKHKAPTCVRRFGNTTSIPLYLPESPLVPFTFGPSSRTLVQPGDALTPLGNSLDFFRITQVADNQTFVNDIRQNFRNLSLGGVSFDLNTGASLVAWEASPPGFTGPSMLNLATNVLYQRALNMSGSTATNPTLIKADYAAFPPIAAGTLVSLKWLIFYGAVMVRGSLTYLRIVDSISIGCIPCLLYPLCCKGTSFISSSHANVKWSNEPHWPLVGSFDV